MPLLETVGVRFRLSSIKVEQADDRWGGDEPYVIPVFFKIDGERYSMRLNLLDDPDEAATLTLKSDPFHRPVIRKPGRPLILGESVEEGGRVRLDVQFKTNLQPIPFVINVGGVADGLDLLGELADSPILQETVDGVTIGVVNLAFDGISETAAAAIGLEGELESCPPADVDLGELVETLQAELEGLIPGAIGGVFMLLENDDFDEDDARTIQNAVADEVRRVVNETTDTVTMTNPVPDNAPIDDGQVGLSIALALIGRVDPGLWLSVTLGLLWGAPDDLVGAPTKVFLQHELARGGNPFELPESGPKRWILRGNCKVGRVLDLD